MLPRSVPIAKVQVSVRPRGGLAVLCYGWRRMRVVLGDGGVTYRKREGDRATPLGTFQPISVYYRSDRGRRPITGLPILAIRPYDGWCDDPRHGAYNRPVRQPFGASHERLWREDGLYDLVVVLTHNQCPRIRNRGSAIFMHVAAADFSATHGCIAMAKSDLTGLIAHVDRDSRIVIGQ
jgi:L,D-peptidoglycan transpeptidase YkuD (ErfK/YbiS/YcfS/YnhG family)